MKSILFPIVFFIIQISSAQVTVDWRIDNTISNPTVITTDLLHDGLNTYLSIQNYNTQQTVYIYKLDSSGIISATQTIDYMYPSCDRRMVRTPDGSIFICGQRDSLFYPSKIKVVKLDSSLNVLWTTYLFNQNADAYHSARIGYSEFDSSLYVVCYHSITTGLDMAVAKLDTDGNLIWSNDSLPALGLSCIRFAIDHNANIRLGGMVYNPGSDEDFTIIGLDANGGNYWSTITNDLLDDRVEDMVIDAQGNIYAYGFFSSASRARVVKCLPTGQIAWSTNVSNFQGVKIAEDASGIYVTGTDSIMGSRLSVIRLDTSGNIIHSGYYSYDASGFISAELSDDSHLYVCYNNDSAGEYRWAVSKFDTSLQMEWTNLYEDPFPSLCYPTSFYLMNGSYLVSGLVSSQVATVKFDESIPVFIQEQKANTLSWYFAENKLFFRSESSAIKTGWVEIFDITSHLVLRKKIQWNEVDLESLEKGIYFFRLSESGSQTTGRFLKM